MRKILFKGKRIDTNDWVHGSLVNFWDETFIVPITSNAFHRIGIAPVTVCQYTGLKDLNGDKIFEGDIVKKRSDGRIAVVDWGHGSWMLSNWTDEMFDYDFLSNWCSDHSYYGENIGGCTVIGNVHDDYNLLISEEEK